MGCNKVIGVTLLRSLNTKIRVFSNLNSPDTGINGVGVREYSVYPPFYIHPIFRDAEQKKLAETGDSQRYAFIPVRAATVDHNASIFYDPLYSKVVNFLVKEGNKLLARNLLEKSFETIKRVQLEKYNKTTDLKQREKIILNPWVLLHSAVENSRPFLETAAIKRGGHTYQVPVPINERRSYFLSIKWLIEAGSDKEDDMRFYRKFAFEIIDAANDQGRVIKRKQDLHRLCEANRAYAHYRWS